MTLSDVASPRRWHVANRTPGAANITLSGWDFGGQGELALLSHANGLCAAAWAPVAQQLTGSYRVIAIDARGHGDSAQLSVPDDYPWSAFVDDLLAVGQQVCDEFEVAQIALGVGSSYGGIITAAAAARAPALFGQVVMLDPPIHPTPELITAMGLDMPAPATSGREHIVEQALRRRSVWPSREVARAAWQDKPLFVPWTDAAFQIYLDEGMVDLADGQVQLKCSPQVEAHIFATTGSLGLMDYAPHVQVPVHLVHARDGFFPYEFFAGIAQVLPNATLSQLPAGHMLPLEAPQAVARLLLQTGLQS